jgi:hypothetical protein
MTFFNIQPERIYSLNSDAEFSRDGVGGEYYKTDSYGFRYNPGHEVYETPDLTIIMVGDSFTYGVGNGFGVRHEVAYPARVEAILREKGIQAAVHNAGVPGYGPDQEFIYMKNTLIPEYKPDLIVWNLSANDVNDSNLTCLFREQNGMFHQISGRRNTLYLQGLLVKHAYRFLKDFSLYNLLLYAPNAVSNTDRFTFGCSYSEDQSEEILHDQFSRKMKFFLAELDELARQEQFRLLVTLAPFQDYFTLPHLDDNLYADYRFLKKTLSDSGIVYVDVNELLALYDEQELVSCPSDAKDCVSKELNSNVLGASSADMSMTIFLEDDQFGNAHLNTLGNELFAQVVYETIAEQSDEMLSP